MENTANFKVGQQVKITQDTTAHNFKNGEIVTVTKIEGQFFYAKNDDITRAVYYCDAKPLCVSQFKIGDKVVPISKSNCGPLSNSENWKKAQKMCQPHLYIIRIDDPITKIVCSWEKCASGGDYFYLSDIIPYTEFKRGDRVCVAMDSAFLTHDRIFIANLGENVMHPYACVQEGDEERFKNGEKIKVAYWDKCESIPPKPTQITVDIDNCQKAIVTKCSIEIGEYKFTPNVVDKLKEALNTLNK